MLAISPIGVCAGNIARPGAVPSRGRLVVGYTSHLREETLLSEPGEDLLPTANFYHLVDPLQNLRLHTFIYKISILNPNVLRSGAHLGNALTVDMITDCCSNILQPLADTHELVSKPRISYLGSLIDLPRPNEFKHSFAYLFPKCFVRPSPGVAQDLSRNN